MKYSITVLQQQLGLNWITNKFKTFNDQDLEAEYVNLKYVLANKSYGDDTWDSWASKYIKELECEIAERILLSDHIDSNKSQRRSNE